MKPERQLAELIFEAFRKTQCRAGHIVMMHDIQFDILDKLNPKEKDIFHTVLNGLVFTGYFIYEKDGSESLRLTKKGYNYIYDDDKVKSMLQVPWVLPDIITPDWDKAYDRLWQIIGPLDAATHYMGGPTFYKLIMKLVDDTPPSWTNYIDDRKKKDLSASRFDYYKDLIDHLDERQRKTFYANVQLYLENSVQEEDDSEAPIVFISYSWDTLEHDDWVLELASKLREKGVDVILDKWELGPLGKPVSRFMEDAVRKSKRVICVMTPNYKLKTDNLTGGVGYEYSIISAEIFTDIKTSKFIPLVRIGPNEKAIPTALTGRKYIDMKDGVLSIEKMEELLRDIYDEPKFKKPPLGQKPKFK